MTATPFPMANQTTFNDLPSMLHFADNAAGAGNLGLLLVTTIFGVAFLAMTMLGFEKRLLGAGAFAFIASVILAASGLLAAYFAGGIGVALFILWLLTKRYD